MSKAGNGQRAGGAALMDSVVPYATINRRERSRKLAQTRRDKYKSIMDDLVGVSNVKPKMQMTQNVCGNLISVYTVLTN